MVVLLGIADDVKKLVGGAGGSPATTAGQPHKRSDRVSWRDLGGLVKDDDVELAS